MTTIETTRPIRILLIEDDPGDVLLTREALKESPLANLIDVVSNGEEALDFLLECGHQQNARPDLILLDLNLPRLGGLEVLRKVKAEETLCSIPVVVLTTSCTEDDVLSSYRLQASAYVCKPVEVEEFLGAVRGIDEFFVNIARLPGR